VRLPKICVLTHDPICAGHFRKRTVSSAALSVRIDSVTPWWRVASVPSCRLANDLFASETTKATHRVALAERDSDAAC